MSPDFLSHLPGWTVVRLGGQSQSKLGKGCIFERVGGGSLNEQYRPERPDRGRHRRRAQGIGFAIARRLIASGAKVSLWDYNAEALATAVEALGENAFAKEVDIIDLDGLRRVHAETEAEVGPVSILVNSAGVAGNNATLEDYDPDEWRRVVEINLNGTFYVNKVVIPSMKAKNYGRIVNISSVAGKEGNPNLSAYSAAKSRRARPDEDRSARNWRSTTSPSTP